MLIRSLVLFAACVLHAANSFAADVVAFFDVNVVAMTDERVLPRQTVIVRGDRIDAIGPIDSTPIPIGARLVYGGGRWLVPGLIDAHVHIRADEDTDDYVRYGVTTVRDLAGMPPVIATVQRVRRGELVGPEIIYSSVLLHGPDAPVAAGYGVPVSDPNLAPAIVAQQKANGATWIKLYENLTLPVYDALVAAARAQGMPVAGHVSFRVDIRHAVNQQDSIEHLGGYDVVVTTSGGGAFGRWRAIDESRIPEMVRITVAGRAWNCPTLYVYRILAARDLGPLAVDAIAQNRRRFVRALHDGGAPIVLGTDSGWLVDPGIATHEELQEFLLAGLTPFEALATATRDAARFLGRTDLGTIAVGNRADLLLVDANPLESLATLRAPVGVMLRGEWMGTFGRARRRGAGR